MADFSLGGVHRSGTITPLISFYIYMKLGINPLFTDEPVFTSEFEG